jgi:hypothetical protein
MAAITALGAEQWRPVLIYVNVLSSRVIDHYILTGVKWVQNPAKNSRISGSFGL